MRQAKLLVALFSLVIFGSGCTQTVQYPANTPTMVATTTPTATVTNSGNATETTGIYEDYSEQKLADYKQDKLVLFFKAS